MVCLNPREGRGPDQEPDMDGRRARSSAPEGGEIPREKQVEFADELAELAALDAKVNTLLPPQYQSCFESVSPTSMGSAGLKFGPDSRVAWDEIWTHFCDLALAGGPPHRGALLEAPTPQEVEAEPAGYQLVYEEIVRGVRMTTGLVATPGPEQGWVTVRCHGEEMAAWLLRAVVAENVFTRRREEALQVPAGPQFRVGKEIKNVVVALAKTCHYWKDHLSATQQAAAASAMRGGAETAPLLEPPSRPEALARADEFAATTETMARALQQATGLPVVRSQHLGWVGALFPDEATAAWHVRAAIAENILARREAETVYLPVPSPRRGEDRFEAIERVARLHRLWAARQRKITS
jgi:sirohydrochlorin cobaltochelatase